MNKELRMPDLMQCLTKTGLTCPNREKVRKCKEIMRSKQTCIWPPVRSNEVGSRPHRIGAEPMSRDPEGWTHETWTNQKETSHATNQANPWVPERYR